MTTAVPQRRKVAGQCCCRRHLPCFGTRGRPRTTLDVVLADKASASRAIRQQLRKRGIRAVIPVSTDQQAHIPKSGDTASAYMLVRQLNQGPRRRRPPCHAGRLLLTHPENLRPKETALLEKITSAFPEKTALAELVRGVAALIKSASGSDVRLTEWITTIRAAGLPHLHSFTNGLEIDRQPWTPVTPCPTAAAAPKVVNTRAKKIRRQMHGLAGFDLLHHCILLVRQLSSITADYEPDPGT